jgi:putative transposase
MKFRLIAAQRGRFSVRIMCDVRGVSPAEYYAWHGRPESPRKAANRVLLTEIRRVHTAHRGRYGAPRIHAALRAGGYMASRGRVARLMRHHGIQAITPRRFRVCFRSRAGMRMCVSLVRIGVGMLFGSRSCAGIQAYMPLA